ncbi:class I SAM-dependent methyltransferase [Microcystis sp. M158S2]|uniref:class I SAM-dependent methyltransferase n=1 Tax=Microcystis sp. M158S2 TaxID=2771152 RepID=UPI00258E37C0|nr:class I SAM-dependent methyltransferase [Microcystis sp. M158S2]MCA2733122.1 methyltransferase domain-containing protein [Microcystis sp. M158S2]
MTKNSQHRILYRVEQLPIFQNRMYDSEIEAKNCPKGDVCLVEDHDTGLVYNASFVPELMIYDQHYQNEQAVSPLFQQHLNDVLSIIKTNMGKDDLVEVGCGKGFFLEMLLKDDFKITGFDPTYEGINPNIEKEYFTSNTGIKSKGIVLRHVLEHIQNPIDFLFQLKESNGGSGKIYIEVPCFDWICKHYAWFDIFYEHVNYFRLTDFHHIFTDVLASGKLFEGQYIYVVAELSSLQIPKINNSCRVNFPLDFLQKLKDHQINQEAKSAIWGGASKGVIFALLNSRLGSLIDIVIDINPAKQNKYLPGTGIKVRSESEVFDLLPSKSTIFIMNSNYLEEIKKMSKYLFNYVSIDNE